MADRGWGGSGSFVDVASSSRVVFGPGNDVEPGMHLGGRSERERKPDCTGKLRDENPITAMNRLSKLKITAYIVGIFVAGLVTGFVIACLLARHFMPNQEKMTRRWTEELQTKLNLTADQLAKVEPIIRETMGQFKTMLVNDSLSTLSNCNARIAVELTPEQKTKFEQIENEQREFILKRFGNKTETQ
jgi:hypothetical protein